MPDAQTRPYLRTPEHWASFLSAFVHELRTPLASLQMLGELLSDPSSGSSGEGARRNLENVRQVVQELLGLVADAGELARLLAGKAAVWPEEVELAQLVPQLEERVRPQAWERGIGLLLTLDPALSTPLRIDRDRLRQALVLLLEAAVRHARSEVSARLALAGGRLLAVISSDGPPFPDGAAGTQFEPFGEGSRKLRAEGGRIMSLPLANELVLALGGALWAENRGKRPSFTLEIPLAGA